MPACGGSGSGGSAVRSRRITLAVAVAVAGACVLGWGSASHAAGAAEDGPSPAQFFALYTADALWNVHGGLREGAAYLDYIEVAAGFDADRALGWHELTFYASAFRRNDPTFSDRHVGDAMVVSNIDSANRMQVLEAWLERRFDARGPGSWRIGLYDLSAEFDTLESRALFLNSAYGIGHDLSQTGLNGPSIYPQTALGVRLAWAPHEAWLLKTAILDGVPGDPEERGRSRLHLSGSEGALWISEAMAGHRRLRGGFGYWRYTAAFPQLRPPDADGTARTRNNNTGGYAMVELASAAVAGSGEPRWRAFLRAGTAQSDVNVFDRFLAVGAAYRSSWPGRRGSVLGLAVAEARIGDPFREQRAAEGLATEGCERNAELTWRFPLGKHAALQPDLQYVQNPNGDPQLSDAWVVGVRVELFATR